MSVTEPPETLQSTWALEGVICLLIHQTLSVWAVSAPGPALTGLPGWEEVQAVTTQAVRTIGGWGSL